MEYQGELSSNVMALDLNQAQYAIIPNENGGAVDDAYLYRFDTAVRPVSSR